MMHNDQSHILDMGQTAVLILHNYCTPSQSFQKLLLQLDKAACTTRLCAYASKKAGGVSIATQQAVKELCCKSCLADASHAPESKHPCDYPVSNCLGLKGEHMKAPCACLVRH